MGIEVRTENIVRRKAHALIMCRNMLWNLGKNGPDSDVHLFNSFFYNKIGASHLRYV